jgi:hypothetical protein
MKSILNKLKNKWNVWNSPNTNFEKAKRGMLINHIPIVDGKIKYIIMGESDYEYDTQNCLSIIWEDIKDTINALIWWVGNKWRLLHATPEEWEYARRQMLMCSAPIVNGKINIIEVGNSKESNNGNKKV